MAEEKSEFSFVDDRLRQQVNDIHKVLCGDEYNDEGLIKKVTKHEKRLNRHDAYIYGVVGAYLFLIFLLMYGERLIKIM